MTVIITKNGEVIREIPNVVQFNCMKEYWAVTYKNPLRSLSDITLDMDSGKLEDDEVFGITDNDLYKFLMGQKV